MGPHQDDQVSQLLELELVGVDINQDLYRLLLDWGAGTVIDHSTTCSVTIGGSRF